MVIAQGIATIITIMKNC